MIHYKNQNVILNVLNTLTNVQSRAHTRNTPRILIDAVEARSAPWRWCRYRVDAGFTIGRWSLTGQLVVGLAVGNIRGFLVVQILYHGKVSKMYPSHIKQYLFLKGGKKKKTVGTTKQVCRRGIHTKYGYIHYEKTVLRPRPKTCDYRPDRFKAALF